jgi:hypothetical protein
MLRAFTVYCAIIWAALVVADYEGYAVNSLFGQHRHDSKSGAHGFYGGASQGHK